MFSIRVSVRVSVRPKYLAMNNDQERDHALRNFTIKLIVRFVYHVRINYTSSADDWQFNYQPPSNWQPLLRRQIGDPDNEQRRNGAQGATFKIPTHNPDVSTQQQTPHPRPPAATTRTVSQ
ncbi:hypothetical protein FQA39_LY05136 [Lamprigera yunnana]|nr:hypothetical protein FQA39_LY05136 [Lamprigera yunnana]